MKKKCLAIMAALCMLLMLLPATAFAEGVTTESELAAAVEQGGDILLGADMALTNTLVIDGGQEVVLDLGGKILSSSLTTAVKVTDGSLTVKNGTVDVQYEAFRVDGKDCASAEEAVLTLASDVTVTSVNDCCVFILNKATLNTAADLTSKGDYCTIQGNGNAHGTVVNITDGSVIHTSSGAIYVPQNNIMTISGGVISGSTALYYKSGTLTISGGTLVGNGEKADYEYNGNGFNATGDALVVDNCNYPGGEPVVEITGGTFVSENAAAVGSYAKDETVERLDGMISGGSFNTDVGDLLADGCAMEKNEDGVYEIVPSEDSVVAIGSRGYATLAEAVAAVPADGDETTITLLKDASGDGVVVKAGQNIVLDLGTHTYTITGLVGSAGTETNGMQLLKDSTVTLKNGTITSTTAKILIQNYSNLTLENVVLDGTQSSVCEYTVSNNFGSMRATGGTEILAAEGRTAFDLWYGMSEIYKDGITVTFDKDFTGKVEGKIEYGAASGAAEDWADKASLSIEGGTFDTQFVASNGNDITQANITVSGGSFTSPLPEEFCADGFELVDKGDGTFGVCNHENVQTGLVNAKEPTCVDKGYTGDKVCADCGTVLEKGTEIPATGVHTYGDWTTVKEATASETGLKERVCTVCGHKETAEIPMIETPESPETGVSGGVTAGIVLALVLAAGSFGAVMTAGKRKVAK